jgi:hypothetical protein
MMNWKDTGRTILMSSWRNWVKTMKNFTPSGALSEIRSGNITSIEYCHHTMVLVVYSAVSVIHKTM